MDSPLPLFLLLSLELSTPTLLPSSSIKESLESQDILTLTPSLDGEHGLVSSLSSGSLLSSLPKLFQVWVISFHSWDPFSTLFTVSSFGLLLTGTFTEDNSSREVFELPTLFSTLSSLPSVSSSWDLDCTQVLKQSLQITLELHDLISAARTCRFKFTKKVAHLSP